MHPEIQQRAREEAISILGDEPEDVLPTVADTKNMTYINQIIKEVLIHNTNESKQRSCLKCSSFKTISIERYSELTDQWSLFHLALRKKIVILQEHLFPKAHSLLSICLIFTTVRRIGVTP